MEEVGDINNAASTHFESNISQQELLPTKNNETRKPISNIEKAAPVLSEEGKQHKSEEITHSEVELKKSEIQFQFLASNIKDYVIFMLDSNGCVATWNAGARYLKEYSPEEIIGKPLAVFYTQQEINNGVPDLNLTLQKGHLETEGIRVGVDGLHTQGILRGLYLSELINTPGYYRRENALKVLQDRFNPHCS